MSDLHSVEMVGDAVRTPIIQQIVKEVYGIEISKTLMPDETLARGATLFVFIFNIGCHEFTIFFNERLYI